MSALQTNLCFAMVSSVWTIWCSRVGLYFMNIHILHWYIFRCAPDFKPILLLLYLCSILLCFTPSKTLQNSRIDCRSKKKAWHQATVQPHSSRLEQQLFWRTWRRLIRYQLFVFDSKMRGRNLRKRLRGGQLRLWKSCWRNWSRWSLSKLKDRHHQIVNRPWMETLKHWGPFWRAWCLRRGTKQTRNISRWPSLPSSNLKTKTLKNV